ncbi:MAG: hypothetical protein ACRDHV_02320 [Actinomycetota bacterium]
MTRYLLSVHTVEGEARDQMTDEERRESFKQLAVLGGRSSLPVDGRDRGRRA